LSQVQRILKRRQGTALQVSASKKASRNFHSEGCGWLWLKPFCSVYLFTFSPADARNAFAPQPLPPKEEAVRKSEIIKSSGMHIDEALYARPEKSVK
jgi:hypothetical protein